MNKEQTIDIHTRPQSEADDSSDDSSSSQIHFSSYIVVVLLVLGVLGVYVPQLSEQFSTDARAVDDALSYVVDLDYWQRTDRERSVTTTARFDLAEDLSEIPLELGDWHGEERPDSNQEVEILLDPEQYVRRLYYNTDGAYIWLSLIGGRSSQPFHPPDICYDADGWTYNLGSHPFRLPGGGEIYGLWLDAEKQDATTGEKREHIVSYFYVFPDGKRNLADGIVLFKLTSGQLGTLDETLSVHEDFLQTLFTYAN